MYRYLLILLLIGGTLKADRLEEALEKAQKMHLSQSRYWHLLLHMPRETSEIDDPAFFLAPEGKTDAAAELNATITALYEETRFDDNATGCLYPARRYWLRRTLELEGLPDLHCRAFERIVKKVDPQAATLVFSAAHINSPASMFGHTFIRIDSSYDSKMLSHAINYAAGADPDKENGILFAFKGLFGGYPGLYSMLPYYEKLKEYRDSEQRDIWEYDLDFSPDEVMMMVRHIWEIQRVYNWYFFFDENCSYNMFWLMEIARPSIRLREHFTYQVIPLETVHATEAEGVVKARHYRPSKRTILLAYEAVLDDNGTTAAKALVFGETLPEAVLNDSGISRQKKRYILEAAAELAQYHLMKGDLDKPTYLKRYHAVLSARATLGRGEKVPIRRPANPDEGHRATRAAFAAGWRDGRPLQTIGIRPAYHDLGDSDIGFLRGTQIEFLDLVARYDHGGAAVEKATLLSIVSIAPLSAFFKPFSWRMHAGWDQSFYTRKTTFSLSVGAGYSAGNGSGYLYTLFDPEIFVTDRAVTALKPSIGSVLYTGSGSKLHMEAGYRFYDDGMRLWTAKAMQTFRLGQNNAMKLSFDYEEKRDGVQRSCFITYHHYY